MLLRGPQTRTLHISASPSYNLNLFSPIPVIFGGPMLVPKPQLIPSPDQVRDLLRETGALRQGHFEFPTGLHSSDYFQMPLAMRYHGNARVLNVALSRLLRREPEVLA